MTKIAVFLFLFISSVNTFASSLDNLPDQFEMYEHMATLNIGFDIMEKNTRLGALYRTPFSILANYELIDNDFKRKVIASAKYDYDTPSHHGALPPSYLEVYDETFQLLGITKEKSATLHNQFDILAPNGLKKIAQAEMNFWGTTISIYEVESHAKIAEMTRPFFRVKNNWVVDIIDAPLLAEHQIDPKLIITLIAFHCDNEKKRRKEISGSDATNQL